MRFGLSSIFRQCLHALQAWDGFTSSECERGFAGIRRALGKHRSQSVDTQQSLTAKLVLDIAEAEKAELVRAAQVIWMNYWGPSRRSGKSCIHFSTKRKLPTDVKTETGFVRKRRCDVDRGLQAQGGGGSENIYHNKFPSHFKPSHSPPPALSPPPPQKKCHIVYIPRGKTSRSRLLAEASEASKDFWTAKHTSCETSFARRSQASLALAAAGNTRLTFETTAIMCWKL